METCRKLRKSLSLRALLLEWAVATARLFGERGACVGLIARSRRRLEAAKKEIEAAGGHSLALVADVANAQEIETAAEQIENEFGPIDIWINNAMATVFAPFHEVTPEEFRRTTEVTYLGYVYGTMAALKRMKPRDRGVIRLQCPWPQCPVFDEQVPVEVGSIGRNARPGIHSLEKNRAVVLFTGQRLARASLRPCV